VTPQVGLDAALHEKPRPGAVPTLDGEAEAIVIATACSPVPEGRARWTARMLANRLVELEIVEGVSEDTILRVLKKVTSSRGRRSRGACPRA
jgi:Homeodomain-like domain